MQKELIDITWEQGVNVSEPSTTLSAGEAEKIQNWYPARTGLRARRGWVNGTTTVTAGSFPSPRIGRGLFVAPLSGAGSYFYAAHATTNTSYEIWRHASGDLDSGSWTQFVSAMASSDTSYPVAFATSTTGDVKYETGGSASASGGSAKFRTNAFHNDLYFQGGSVQDTTYKQEDVTDGAETIAVGYEDGYPVLDMTSYRGNLAIGKGNGVWLLSGAGLNTYSIKKIDGDASAALGRSLCATPHGLFIVGYDGVWNYQNQTTRISGPIEGDFAVPSTGFVHTAYQNGMLYIAASDGLFYTFNVATGAWSTEVPAAPDDGPNAVYSNGNEYLYATTMNASVNSLGIYRKLSTLTPAKDANMGEVFWAKTPLMFLGDGGSKVTTREVYIQVRQHGFTSGQPPLEIKVYNASGNVIQTQYHELATQDPDVQRIRVDFGANAEAFQLELKHTMASGSSVPVEIEKIQAVVLVSERQ